MTAGHVVAELRGAVTGFGLDPLVARQFEILEQAFVPHQVDAALRRETIELAFARQLAY